MKIHEYQAKQILSRHGVPNPRGESVTNLTEAKRAAKNLDGKVVVKAQIHAGGRGKGRMVASAADARRLYPKLVKNPKSNAGEVKGQRVGGVRLADNADRAAAEAKKILGKVLVTIQTGPEGRKVQRLLIEEQTAVAKEYYASVTMDGALAQPVLIVSAEGGQDIEAVAKKSPDAIIRVPIDPTVGFPAYKGRQLAKKLGMPKATIRPTGDLFAGLYQAFISSDASMVEVNPFVVTTDNQVLALDAKISYDDNADFRQPLEALRDRSEEDPTELDAEASGIGSYIKLDGNIGCMVNGAGLAMATMDTIKLAGGEPANFLDIGTVNRKERVIEAIRIINSDPDVKAILVNIFGGMARVDVIAEGIVDAFKKYRIKHPVVVRLAGSNVEEGRKVLAEADLPLIVADDLGDAARKVVNATKAKSKK